MRIIRARLDGIDAEPGRVAAADVARIIVGLERAIARAAYVVLGRPRRGSGRHTQAIESAARLRFVGFESGSLVELLALPDTCEPADNELPVPIADLSSQAFDRLLDAITSGGPEMDAELAAAVAQMAAELGIGDRNVSITLSEDIPSPGRRAPRAAKVDATVRERMQRFSIPMKPSKADTLVGVLVEADFESHTARLRLANGTGVTVNFSPDLEDDIYEALRGRASFQGLVHYHPKTSQALTVELRTVVVNTQLQLELEDEQFWRVDSFADLQAAQRTSGRVDVAHIVMTDLTDDERAAFAAALAECAE
jgi:hypothetical protein